MSGHAIPIKLRQFVDTSPEVPTGIIHHQGKDVLGYYPGQLARLHIAYPPEGQSRLFTELQPIPVEHKIVTYHDYDYFVLNQYIYYQRTRKRLLDWYILTTYREAFMLPIYKSDSAEDSYRSRAQQEAEALAVWKSNSAKRESVKPSFMGV